MKSMVFLVSEKNQTESSGAITDYDEVITQDNSEKMNSQDESLGKSFNEMYDLNYSALLQNILKSNVAGFDGMTTPKICWT